MTPPDALPDDQLLDYVLGLLEPIELTALERRLATDPAARAEVRALRESLLSLSHSLPEVAPPEGAYQQLASSFRVLRTEEVSAGEDSAEETSATRASRPSPPKPRTAPPTAPQPTPAPSVPRRPTRAFPRHMPALPRVLALAVSSLAVLAIVLWGAATLRINQSGDPLTAYLNDPSVRRFELKDNEGTPTGRVLLRPDGRTLISMTVALPPGKVFQAWGVTGPANHRVATPLGQTDGQQLEISREAYPILWISIEPSGGSPQPTRKVGRVKVG